MSPAPAGPITPEGAAARAELYAGQFDASPRTLPVCLAANMKARAQERRAEASERRYKHARKRLKAQGRLPTEKQCEDPAANGKMKAMCAEKEAVLDPLMDDETTQWRETYELQQLATQACLPPSLQRGAQPPKP